MLVRYCTICKKLQPLTNFQSKVRPTICNSCQLNWIPPNQPKAPLNQGLKRQKDKITRENMVEFFDFYSRLPHVDFSQPESLVLYTQVKARAIYDKYLEYQNQEFHPKEPFNTIMMRCEIEKHGSHIWRYITHKKCFGCFLWLPTYEGADDPAIVEQVLVRTGFRPKSINFARKRFKQDLLSDYCESCLPQYKATCKRCVPWLRNTIHDPNCKDILVLPIDTP